MTARACLQRNVQARRRTAFRDRFSRMLRCESSAGGSRSACVNTKEGSTAELGDDLSVASQVAYGLRFRQARAANGQLYQELSGVFARLFACNTYSSAIRGTKGCFAKYSFADTADFQNRQTPIHVSAKATTGMPAKTASERLRIMNAFIIAFRMRF